MKMSTVFLLLIVFLFSPGVIAEPEENERYRWLTEEEEEEEEEETMLLENCPEMVFVKGGCFEMGDISGAGHVRERPVHEICVGDFYLGKYEVTQKEWKEIMKTKPSYGKRCNDCPVDNISWLDIRKFIMKLKEKTGKKYRLPTEAEWEYAARSGGKKEMWSGTSDEVELEDYAWYKDNSFGKKHPVGEKEPNGLGIYDMSGNVMELVWDRYDREYYKSSPKDNPKGALDKSNRVIRGGSWYYEALDLRTAYRDGIKPGEKFKGIGFRIALSAE